MENSKEILIQIEEKEKRTILKAAIVLFIGILGPFIVTFITFEMLGDTLKTTIIFLVSLLLIVLTLGVVNGMWDKNFTVIKSLKQKYKDSLPVTKHKETIEKLSLERDSYTITFRGETQKFKRSECKITYMMSGAESSYATWEDNTEEISNVEICLTLNGVDRIEL